MPPLSFTVFYGPGEMCLQSRIIISQNACRHFAGDLVIRGTVFPQKSSLTVLSASTQEPGFDNKSSNTLAPYCSNMVYFNIYL